MDFDDKDIRISVIVPTKGRLSLKATVMSILGQLRAGDELIVVHDGLGDYWPAIPLDGIPTGANLIFSRTEERTRNSGASQRDHGIAISKGTHLMFCDDDDIFVADALAAARDRIVRYPDKLLVFQMEYGDGRLLWADPEIRLCNTGTPMLVMPNIEGLPTWEQFDKDKNIHDFLWARAVMRMLPEPIFVRKVLSIIRPRTDQLPKGC
jgi:glycosyltransferase involved in cell wall biosynthesis